MKLGIIGGNGVAATNLLNTLIEQRITRHGAFRDAHHPEIITWQATQAPSRSLFLEGRGESFVPQYVEVGKILKAAGCTKLCMCCNTAHAMLETLQAEIGLPFINLIEIVVQSVKQTPFRKVGLLASDGCIKGNVYGKYFEKFPEIEIVYPEPEFQKMVTRGICNVKNSFRFADPDAPERPRHLWQLICSHLHELGAELIVLGCTDIAVDWDSSVFNALPVINSLEVLADTISDEFLIEQQGKGVFTNVKH